MSPKKEAILAAATQFFAQRGYKDTDVQCIADHLGIGKGTIYRNFPSKKELFLSTVDRAIDILEDYIHEKASQATSDIDIIRQALYAYFSFFKTHPEFVELFVQERSEFRAREASAYHTLRVKRDFEWKETFARMHAKGQLRLKDTQTIIETMTNFLYGMLFSKIFHLNDAASDAIVHTSIDILLHGISHSSTTDIL